MGNETFMGMALLNKLFYLKRPTIMRKDIQTISETFVNLEKPAQAKTREKCQRAHLARVFTRDVYLVFTLLK